ncbi:GAF domain-containing protein [Candidatus Bathyarchaeota archaeon]|nr:GAF domain-containing protein [Candidatus Bathyarchaeota archaeon]
MNIKKNEKTKLYEASLREIIEKTTSKTMTEKMVIICQSLKRIIPYYYWVGFYLPRNEYLELGPSNGPPACFQIPYSGVCGKVAKTVKPIIVPDVNKFPGHISCDPRSKSEIAMPVLDSSGKLLAVFDVDSEEIGIFDETDEKWLHKILDAAFIEKRQI